MQRGSICGFLADADLVGGAGRLVELQPAQIEQAKAFIAELETLWDKRLRR